VYDRRKDTACKAVRGDRRVSYDPLANETGRTPPPALPEKEKTREIPDFCTEMICDKGGGGGGGGEEKEGEVVITPQNLPLFKIIMLAVTLVGWKPRRTWQ